MKKCLLGLLFLSLSALANFKVELEKTSIDVLEGEVSKVKFSISGDLDQKYSVSLNACYPWISLSKIDKHNFVLTFSPNFTSIIDNQNYVFEINFDVTSSSGQVEEKTLLANIINVDQLPEFDFGANYQGKEFHLELEAFDPNGELSPTIELIQPPTHLGDIRLSDLDVTGDPYYPSSRKLLTWTKIPKDQFGSTQKLVFKVCTKTHLCREQTVDFLFDN